jgi:MFS family permease
MKVHRFALSHRSLIAAMCLGQIGNLLPHVVLSANLAQHLMPAWGLTAGEGGLLASGYAFGYMLAVPVLTTLTDRIDARLVLLCGSIVSGLATIAFGLFAVGFWSGMAIWSLAGLGFAGAYMPGLKALTDRLQEGDTSRAVTCLRRARRGFGREQSACGGIVSTLTINLRRSSGTRFRNQ